MKRVALALSFLLGFLLSCAPTVPVPPEPIPARTILVLPPESLTSNTDILETLYPIISKRLAQRGYYCISPELALAIFNANNMNNAGRINSVPPKKLLEIFGADAVLKTKVTEWSSKYYVVGASVNVGLSMDLYTAKSDAPIWSRQEHRSSETNIKDQRIWILIDAILHSALEKYEPIADSAAISMFQSIPPGPLYGTH